MQIGVVQVLSGNFEPILMIEWNITAFANPPSSFFEFGVLKFNDTSSKPRLMGLGVQSCMEPLGKYLALKVLARRKFGS